MCAVRWSAVDAPHVTSSQQPPRRRRGFNLLDSEFLPPSMSRPNYKSTSGVNKLKVETRIHEEIVKGNYVICGQKPCVCSALGAIPKGESDVRLIHDLSRPDGGLNAFAWDTSVSFSTLDMATSRLPENGFMAKIDLAAAYRSIPIHPSNYDFTGLRWKFEGELDYTYMFDARLPFGAAKSCQIFQRISDAVVRMMDRRGLVIFSYIEDMICISDTELNCKHVFDMLVDLLTSLGLNINWLCLTKNWYS
jgi:hypothetical protein